MEVRVSDCRILEKSATGGSRNDALKCFQLKLSPLDGHCYREVVAGHFESHLNDDFRDDRVYRPGVMLELPAPGNPVQYSFRPSSLPHYGAHECPTHLLAPQQQRPPTIQIHR